jgi:hypothetical protein
MFADERRRGREVEVIGDVNLLHSTVPGKEGIEGTPALLRAITV